MTYLLLRFLSGVWVRVEAATRFCALVLLLLLSCLPAKDAILVLVFSLRGMPNSFIKVSILSSITNIPGRGCVSAARIMNNAQIVSKTTLFATHLPYRLIFCLGCHNYRLGIIYLMQADLAIPLSAKR